MLSNVNLKNFSLITLAIALCVGSIELSKAWIKAYGSEQLHQKQCLGAADKFDENIRIFENINKEVDKIDYLRDSIERLENGNRMRQEATDKLKENPPLYDYIINNCGMYKEEIRQRAHRFQIKNDRGELIWWN